MDKYYFEVRLGYTLSRKEIKELIGRKGERDDGDFAELAHQLPYMNYPYESVYIEECPYDQVCLAILEIVIRLTPNSFEIGVYDHPKFRSSLTRSTTSGIVDGLPNFLPDFLTL